MLAFPGAWQAGIKHLSIKLTAPGRKGGGVGRAGELGTQLQAGSFPTGDNVPARERGQGGSEQSSLSGPCSLASEADPAQAGTQQTNTQT